MIDAVMLSNISEVNLSSGLNMILRRASSLWFDITNTINTVVVLIYILHFCSQDRTTTHDCGYGRVECLCSTHLLMQWLGITRAGDSSVLSRY